MKMSRGNHLLGTVFLALACLFLSVGMSAATDFPHYEVPQDCLDQVQEEGSKLHIYDWAAWWPEAIYTGFEEKYGITIVRDNFASEDEVVTKFKLNPRSGYDITLVGIKPLLQLKAMKLLHEINHDWVPNVNHYLRDKARNAFYDPGYQYSVTDDFVMAIYEYNAKYVDPDDPRTDSYALLFEGEEYAKEITMINDKMYVVGAALKYLGYSWNSDDPKELEEAKQLLLKQKDLVMAYDSWPKRLVLEEEAKIAQCWSGDPWFLHTELPTIRGVMPKEGTQVDIDAMLIPKHAPHPAAAHLWINYVFSPEVNQRLIESIGYIPMHKATAENLPQEMQDWPGLVPSDAYLEKCDFTHPRSFTGQGQKLRQEIWEELKR